MKLLPLDSAARIELAAGWLAQPETCQWLDFAGGQRTITPALLKIMAQRESHCLRLYTSHSDDTPVGIVGFNSIDRTFKTATLWGATGDRSFRSRGFATFAGSKFLTFAFDELGLRAINTWVVDGNPSQRLVERLNFRYVGRMRQCHHMNGKPCDRLYFDLLAGEHREIAHEQMRARPRENVDGRTTAPTGAS